MFRIYVCLFAGTRLGSGFSVYYMGLSQVVVEVIYFIRTCHLMLGHRVDACASHVVLCASCGCFLITRDALRIILDVFCIVFDAWASFDACASCVELGAPWVTEASQLRGIFLFFSLCLVAFYIRIYSRFISLDFAGYDT